MFSAGFEHEQSCERTASESTGAETGASSNADIEDNDRNVVISSLSGLLLFLLYRSICTVYNKYITQIY